MKKRLLTILLATTMIFSLIACGGSEEADTPSDNTTENSTAENTVPEKEEPVDDGIIDFEGETFKITYTKHETGTDYEGNPCLYYYFTFVNNGEEAASAAVTSYIQCFQNGIECDIAINLVQFLGFCITHVNTNTKHAHQTNCHDKKTIHSSPPF